MEAYRTVTSGGCWRNESRERPGTSVRIASPSPVLPPCRISWQAAGVEALRGMPVASIGPITTQTARESGHRGDRAGGEFHRGRSCSGGARVVH